MKSFRIRKMKPKDLSFAYAMNVTERWNDRLIDLERMLRFEREGCFIAEVDRKPVGHVFTVSYGSLGWIGLLIVKAEFRRMGLGRLLTIRAMDYLLSRRVKTIKLEAVPAVSSLYRNLGFVKECESLRLKRGISERSGSVGSKTFSVAQMKEQDLQDVARFDQAYFGANRLGVLKQIYTENQQLCFTSSNTSETIGYLMCRRNEIGYTIGPAVCNPQYPEIAKSLSEECISRLGPNKEIFVGIPAVNAAGVQTLDDLGFVHSSYSIRMRHGEERPSEHTEGIFAIGGPMKG